MCYVYILTPYEEYSHYVLQICTDKNEMRKKLVEEFIYSHILTFTVLYNETEKFFSNFFCIFLYTFFYICPFFFWFFETGCYHVAQADTELPVIFLTVLCHHAGFYIFTS